MTGDATDEFDKYRGYLRFLARQHLRSRYHGKLDQSDIVQQTLLSAFAARDQYVGQTEAERLAWMRQILVHTVARATRGLLTQKRDINRERSIEADLNASSMRLRNFLASPDSSPSQTMVREENLRMLAEAIERLPDEQREVVELRYWGEMSVKQLSEALGKSPAAIAGLLHRGTKRLRALLEMRQT
ncbi:MAG: sigma-70 family RNA polymerase sigma factor [Aureliella sp.]